MCARSKKETIFKFNISKGVVICHFIITYSGIDNHIMLYSPPQKTKGEYIFVQNENKE